MASHRPATEVTSFPLQAGLAFQDESSPAHQLWQEALSTISSQPGFLRAYYGLQIENPAVLHLAVDWDSVDHQKQWMASPENAPFREKLGAILAQRPKLFHFLPRLFPPAILASAPCTEMATFFQTEDKFLRNVEQFIECLKGAEGYLGHSFGDVVEEIEKEEGRVKGKAVLLCIGWESKEAHMKFRETEPFKSNVHLLREGTSGAEMHHVAFKAY